METVIRSSTWAGRGFKGVKAKIGYPTLAEDVQVIRAMREAVGPSIALMVDYNQSLSPVEARARLAALEDEDLTWVEEPVLAHRRHGPLGMCRLRRVAEEKPRVVLFQARLQKFH